MKKLVIVVAFFISMLNAKGSIKSASLNGLKEGMRYSKARVVLLLNGWKVVKNKLQDSPRTNRVNSYYYDNGWIELEDCSGLGKAFCLFKYKDSFGNILKIVTAEESLDPKVDNWNIANSASN